MSVEPTDEMAEAAEGNEIAERYAGLETGDAFVIYDRKNHRAWLQSAEAVQRDEMR